MRAALLILSSACYLGYLNGDRELCGKTSQRVPRRAGRDASMPEMPGALLPLQREQALK